jgi:hypothetical protein
MARKPLHRLRPGLIAAVLAAGACTENPQETINLPAWGSSYVFFFPHLRYFYLDTATENSVLLKWEGSVDNVHTFVGWNCLLFAPTAAGDSTGTFYFVVRGANRGRLHYELAGTLQDSLDAYLLPPSQSIGTTGSFVTHSSGGLLLNWANGTPSRYFDPAANLRFEGDTIFSDVTINFESGFVTWRAGWILAEFCPQ